MTTSRRKRPVSALAPPLTTVHVIRSNISKRTSSGDQTSFATLLIQVGLVVAILLSALYTFLSSTNVLWNVAPRHHKRMRQAPPENQKKYRVHYRPETADPPETLPSRIDVLTQYAMNGPSSSLHGEESAAYPELAHAANTLRHGFVDNFGDASRRIYQRGIWSPNLDQGTERLTQYLQQLSSSTPIFHLVVAGNSAPAGYGNHRHETYASRLQELLQPAFASLGIEWRVSNWAMNDLVEFPFAWCLPHYLQQQSSSNNNNTFKIDMMIWDFNFENHPVARLEAFLRHVIATHHVPFWVVRNGFRHDAYFGLLKNYHTHGQFQDVTVISDAHAVEEFWQGEAPLPKGLANWDHFGVKGGTPDQLHPHLSVQEHWLVAWLLSMRMLPSLEQAGSGRANGGAADAAHDALSSKNSLPVPILLDTGDTWLLGDEKTGSLSCFTGFEHVLRTADLSVTNENMPPGTSIAHANLPDLVAHYDETSQIVQSLDANLLLKPKSVQFFHHGWVFDLEGGAKRSKQRSQQTDFLGFTDWKTAFYGEYQSGPLRLEVPVLATQSATAAATKVDEVAKRIVLCQADDKMVTAGCSIQKDIRVSVGDIEATKILLESRVVRTIGDKPLCLAVEIPSGALLQQDESKSITVDVQVSNHRVRWNQGPCSVAHVLVEWRP